LNYFEDCEEKTGVNIKWVVTDLAPVAARDTGGRGAVQGLVKEEGWYLA